MPEARANPPPVASKAIALCFDDGPRLSALKELLSVLEKNKAPGNFFVLGCNVLENKELVKRIFLTGHSIENHSWGHPNLKKLYAQKGAEAVKLEVRKTGDTIFNAIGKRPKFFRPPFWEINGEIEKIIIAEGYRVMKLDNPDINTLDYEDFAKKRPPEALINRVKSQIAGREKRNIYVHILVFHELTITTEALKTLIPYFQFQGYRFVLLEEIFP